MISTACFHPDVFLNERPAFSRIPRKLRAHLENCEISELEGLWRKVLDTDWKKKEGFPKDPRMLDFWIYVRNHTTTGATGRKEPFVKLADFVISCLNIAHSTASVER